MTNRRAHWGLGPWRPCCEGLEGRLLLSLDVGLGLPPPSGAFADFLPLDFATTPNGLDFGFPPPGDIGHPGATLKVVGTEPGNRATLSETPKVVAVRFDHPLDVWSVRNDLLLYRLDAHGQPLPVSKGQSLRSSVDPTDPNRLLLDLGSGLEPGPYRLALSANSGLSSGFGSIPLANSGTEQRLADFTVERSGVRLADATDLGPIGPVVQSVAGRLDFASNPSAVALYKIELPPSQRLWQLGLEVTAERQGSPLDAALTLFNDQGQPVATVEDGRYDAPTDPYLFEGLKPGTYYVGVSGQGNLAGRPGGYDPVTGDPGSIVQAQPGGPFTLRLVADPAGAAPRVLGFRLNHADPTDLAPTSFDIQFSGMLHLGDTPEALADAMRRGLEVVDRSGRAWPIAGVAYDEARSILTFEFQARLPGGAYQVRLPGSGGLRDLADRAPSTFGLPRGVLATFDVTANPAHHDPNDFGPLFHDDVPQTITINPTLAPSEARTFRFVTLHDDDLRLTAHHEGGSLRVELIDVRDGTTRVLDLGPSGVNRNEIVSLAAGEYLLRVRADGADPVQVDLELRFFGKTFESLLHNGVGQGPALSLRLVSPTSTSLSYDPPAASPAATSPPGGPVLGPQGLPIPSGPLTSPGTTGGSGPIAPVDDLPFGPEANAYGGINGGANIGSSALLAFGTGPVGLPAPDNNLNAPVGLGVTTVITANTGALLATFGDPSHPLRIASSFQEPPDESSLPTNGAMPADQDVPNPEHEAKAPVVAGIGGISTLIDRIAEGLLADGLLDPSLLLARLQGSRPAPTTPAVEVAENASSTEAPDTISEVVVEEAETDQASIAMPLGFSLAAALVLQFRETLRRWFDRFDPRRRRRVPNGLRHPLENHLSRNRQRERVG